MTRSRLLPFCASLIVATPLAAHGSGIQRTQEVAWDSLRMEFQPFCQIGTCTGYRLLVRRDRRFTVVGRAGKTSSELANARFGNVTDLIASIEWAALPTSLLQGGSLGPCAEITTHQPTFIVELFSGNRSRKIVDSHWCSGFLQATDSDRVIAQSAWLLRHLELVLSSIPQVRAARTPDPETGPYADKAIAGCYTLTLGTWSGPFPSRNPALHQPPAQFELKMTGADTAGDGTIFRAVAPNPAVFGSFPPAWGVHDEQTIEVYWSTGMAGVRLSLLSFGDHLGGHATAFTDLEGPGIVQPTADAKAVRIKCPP